MNKFPYVDAGLLAYLEKLHPDKYPDVSLSDRELWKNSGAVELIRHLRFIHEEQESLMRKT